MATRKASEDVTIASIRKDLVKARKAGGLKALYRLREILTKRDIKSIEKSVREFHTNFKLG